MFFDVNSWMDVGMICDRLTDNLAELRELIEHNTKPLKEMYLESPNLTVEYRDKMTLARRKCLEEYAENMTDDVELLYIYDKSGEKYLASSCKAGKSHEVIELTKEDLKQDVLLETVLRRKNNSYKTDTIATITLKNQIKNKFDALMKEQEKAMESRRIENHIYEVVEKDRKSIWLMDKTIGAHHGFEELKFDTSLFKEIKEGDLLEYKQGKYNHV